MQQTELPMMGLIGRELKRTDDAIVSALPSLGAAMEFATARSGYTHDAMGGFIGYTRSAVSKIFAGTRDITVGRMVTLMARTGSYAPLQKLCEMCGGKFVPDADAVRKQQEAALDEQERQIALRRAELRRAA